MRSSYLCGLLFAGWCAAASAADPLQVVDGRVFQIRGFDGPNNVGVTSQDSILTGIWIAPTVGTLVNIAQVSSNGSINPVTGTTTWGPYNLPQLNSPALPYEFDATYSYATAAGQGLLGRWNVTVTNPGSPNSPLQVQTPSIQNAGLMPLATDVRLSNVGGNPTVLWNNPNSAAFIDIHIHDLSVPRNYFGQSPTDYIGFAPIVHEESSRQLGTDTSLPGNATSFQIPTTFSSGLTLDPTHQYALSILRYQTEQQTVNGITKDWIISRSRTFVNLMVGTDTGLASPPDTIYLPTVTSAPDFTGTSFSFNIGDVGTDLIYLDPAFAVGYEYALGAGDPAFRSVLLPALGDGHYSIEFLDPITGKWVVLGEVEANQEVLFGAAGVRKFRVLGIEEGAQLDPNDPTAFVTGVSFVGPGRFTGSMTAIVPEPGTWIMLAMGLFVLGASARLRRG